MVIFVLSQILGFVALIIACVSYFVKNKGVFLVVQMVANVFYALSFFTLNHLVAGVVTLVSTIRCVYIYFAEKHNLKYSQYYLSIFFVLYVVVGLVFWTGWLDIIPMFTAVMFTIAFYVKDLQLTRYLVLIPNFVLVIYNIICKTYSNAMLDFIEFVVVIVAIVKFYKQNKKVENV